MCIIPAVATVFGVAKLALTSVLPTISWGAAATGVAAVTGLAGTAVGITSSLQEGKSKQAMYNYQAQVDKNNAQIAQNNAYMERQEGIEEGRLQRIKTLSKIGSQQTAMAANGIDISQGTAIDVIDDTAAMGELDALTVQYNQERRALAYESQANNFNNQSNLDSFASRNAYSSGKMGAIAAGINGIGETTSKISNIWGGFSVNPKWKADKL